MESRGKGVYKGAGKWAHLSFEQTAWQVAQKLRGHLDTAEYKHIVLALIFLKYIWDAFQKQYDRIRTDELAIPDDRDEYTAKKIRVPKRAQWSYLQENVKQPTMCKLIIGELWVKSADRLSTTNAEVA